MLEGGHPPGVGPWFPANEVANRDDTGAEVAVVAEVDARTGEANEIALIVEQVPFHNPQ